MKFIPIHYDNTIIGIELFRKKDPSISNFTRIKWNAEQAARDLISTIEEQCCVAFLEALSLEAQRAINRHAKFCFDNDEWEDEDKEFPEWATKYQDAGL